jgi:hypothetical protein
MPPILRSRIALLALMGAFLIPIAMSSLRGLTHILSCQEQSKQPFTVIVPKNGPPEVISSSRITRGQTNELCGGLVLDNSARSKAANEITMVLSITNKTKYGWRGTVSVAVGDTKIPVDIGTIEPHQTVTDSVDFHLDEGTQEVGGELLIGP